MMSRLVFNATHWLLLLSLSFFTYGFAEAKGQPDRQQARILTAVNLLRTTHQQSTLKKIFQQETALTKSGDSLGTGGAITGMLHGVDRGFFPSATVVAWTADSTEGGVGFANVYDGGEYRIDFLPPGDYYVVAVAEGYVPKFYDNALIFPDATPVTVLEGEETPHIDFEMELYNSGDGSVSGKVTSEEDLMPISGAYVSIFSRTNPFLYGYGISNDDGTYTIENLRRGSYYALASAENFLPEYFFEAETFADAKQIQVPEAAKITEVNFTLSRGGQITGRVSNEDGSPVQNAYVEASPLYWRSPPDDPDSSIVDPGTFGMSKVDEDGNYVISGLQSGYYLVRMYVSLPFVYIEEWYDNVRDPAEATPVAVEKNKATTGIDFEINIDGFDGEIAGLVTDTKGQAIVGAYIQAFSVADSAGFGSTGRAVTGRDGRYRIEHLVHGDYLVQATFSDPRGHYVQRWWPNAESQREAEVVIVGDATEPPSVDFTLPILLGTATISGRVFSDDGSALAYASVEIHAATDGAMYPDGIFIAPAAYAVTDSSGSYEVRYLPAGTYFAHAQAWVGDLRGQQWYDHKETYEEATPIELENGEERSRVNFDLPMRSFYGELAGTVTDDETGEPLARAYVEFRPLYIEMIMAPIAFRPFYAVSGDDGTYHAAELPEGAYWISVYTNGGFEYYEDAGTIGDAKTVNVRGGEVTTIDFGVTARKEGSGKISGQVYDAYNDGFLEVAVVKATPVDRTLDATGQNTAHFFNTVIGPQGDYELTGLPEGEYIVSAFSPYHANEYFKDTFDPGQAMPVKVDSLNPATGIDFSLEPIWYATVDSAGVPEANASAAVFGKVESSNGQALSDADVYLIDEGGNVRASTRTSPNGRYELPNIPLGNYRLMATHVGYESAYNGNANNYDAAQLVGLAPGRTEVNFKLRTGSISSVDGKSKLPTTVQLIGNYPNPFNPETQISFSLPEQMQVKITVFNLMGQQIRVLTDGLYPAGIQTVAWDGRSERGISAESGIYFYVLQTSQHHFKVKKMTLLK